ncbi:MAG: hypothetical protein V4727_11545 [Verrucomicrobiota bacterium]
MTKLILTMAAGSALLLVSCEPIPIHPDHRRPGPYPDRHQPQPDRPYPGDRRYDEPVVPQPTPRDQYPVAERTSNPNHVISPYAPYNVINVEGFRSGQLAKDPSNQKVFRIP